MTACTTDRNAPYRQLNSFVDPVAANVLCFGGALAVLDASGNVRPGITATDLVPRGRFVETVDNTGGAAGAKSAATAKGCFAFASDGSITRAHLEKTVYIVDDQTFAATDGGGTRSPGGVLKDIEGQGASATVWVYIG